MIDPAHLGRALAVTTELIDEIETLVTGAFYRSFTAQLEVADDILTRKNG